MSDKAKISAAIKAGNVKKSLKATDRKPKPIGTKLKNKKVVEGPWTKIRVCALTIIKARKLTKKKLTREVSAEIKAAMRKAAPDAADNSINTCFYKVKRELAA